jgi:hypothetical protein
MKHVPIKLFGKEMHRQAEYRILPRMHHDSGAQAAASLGEDAEQGAENPDDDGLLGALVNVSEAENCCRQQNS